MTTIVEGRGTAGAASLGSCPTPLLWSQVSSSSFPYPGSVSLGQVKPHSFNNEFIKPLIYTKSYISLIFTVIQVFICVPPETDPETMIQVHGVIPGNTREWEVKKGRQPIKRMHHQASYHCGHQSLILLENSEKQWRRYSSVIHTQRARELGISSSAPVSDWLRAPPDKGGHFVPWHFQPA